jgi:hypothetical protein
MIELMRETIKEAAYWTTNKGGFFNTMGVSKATVFLELRI